MLELCLHAFVLAAIFSSSNTAANKPAACLPPAR